MRRSGLPKSEGHLRSGKSLVQHAILPVKCQTVSVDLCPSRSPFPCVRVAAEGSFVGPLHGVSNILLSRPMAPMQASMTANEGVCFWRYQECVLR